ncbi:protein kinase domain-containing protein [Catenulispora pinisilvae]|uniref:serine/threonine-protein kinase n=1 Tax=Catenulispora pinisilvae TaxID=2705253 RepID=UPI001891EFB7|nr:serine/threonine-protein kinase [Catenulispora pinisilvae]
MEPLRDGDPSWIGGYRLLGRLGAGGMGKVFLAESPGHRFIALKVVHDVLLREPAFRARFRHEVQAARQVSGAFTAPIADADPEAAVPWLATLYLPSMSLREYVDWFGPLPEARVRALGACLAEALRSIHEAGVSHRDLTPNNVLVTPETVYVIDFGISQILEGTRMTVTGQTLGTVGFTPPEQLTSAGWVGPSGDVFSLAALLVFAALGRGPFEGGRPDEVAYRTVHEEPQLDGFPEDLRAPVAAALAKDPAERPTTQQLLAAYTPVPDQPPQLPAFLAEVARRQEIAADLAAAPVTPPPGPHETDRNPADLTPTVPARRMTRRAVVGSAIAIAAAGAGTAVVATRGGGKAGGRTATPPPGSATSSAAIPKIQPLWSAPLGKSMVAAELVVIGDTVICCGATDVYGFAADSGKQSWTAKGSLGDLSAGLDAIISFSGTSSSGLYGWTGEGLAFLDVAGHVRTVRQTSSDLSLLTSVIVASSGSTLICGQPSYGSSTSRLIAYDVTTGRDKWTHPISPPSNDRAVSTFFAAADDKRCYLQDQTSTYALDLETGTEIWRAQNTVPLGCPKHLVLASGTLLIAGTRLLALDAATGRQLWSAADKWSPAGIYQGSANNSEVFKSSMNRFANLLSITGQRAYFVNGSNTVYAVDASSGKSLWSYTSDSLGINAGYGSFPAANGFSDGSVVAVPFLGTPGVGVYQAGSILLLSAAHGGPVGMCQLPAAHENWLPQVVVSGNRIFTIFDTTVYAFEGASNDADAAA